MNEFFIDRLLKYLKSNSFMILKSELKKERVQYMYNSYLKKICELDETSTISVSDNDIENLKYLLRKILKIYVEIEGNEFKIFNVFPKEFEVVKKISRENHPWFREFEIEVGTKLFISQSNYGTCNVLKGLPLWVNDEVIEGTTLVPSVQIGYGYVSPFNHFKKK